MIVEFTASVFTWEARSEAWYFVALPPEISADIREIPRIPRGFGAVKVVVRIGGSTWSTSIFPDSSRGVYVLPLKRAMREREGITEGADIAVTLEVRDS